MNHQIKLDDTDRRIINALQGGFALTSEPYAKASQELGIEEAELIRRIGELVENGALSRFGPMYNAEALGGEVTLAALAAPKARFDEVAEKVNAHREVAHNYARDHALNMWFVINAEKPGRIGQVIKKIEEETGLQVYNMPKEREFFIGMKVKV